MTIQIFADGADLKTMAALADRVSGFTTNPSLLAKSGVTDYRAFAREVLAIAGGKPVSFEVLADDFPTMERQAREIAGWGENVFVKVPVVNARGEFNARLIATLTDARIKVNVTAILSLRQGFKAFGALESDGNILSVFAGRIADTGADARAVVAELARAYRPRAKILWASARQVYSVIEAEQAGADIITLTPDLIAKLDGFGRDLEQYSLETVKQFVRDAEGITL